MIELRVTLRALWRSAGFTAAALATLALGIGANTAIFSLINATMLRPLPYPEAERIVQLWMTFPDGGGGLTLSIPEFNLFARQDTILEDVAGYDFGGPGVNLTGAGEPEQVKAIHVSANYFRLFGARVAFGRSFTAEEDRPGGGRVAVLGHSLWMRRFQGDPAVVGKTISLGHEDYLVAGVLAPDFRPDPPAQVWLPLQADPNSRGQANYIRVAGRLRHGVGIEQANARLKLAAAEILREYPRMNRELGFEARPLRETNVRDIRAAMMVLFGTVTLVLLIACSNVANLLLARATARQREMAIRAALGASGARLAGHLLVEVGLLAAAGGVLGLALGQVCLRVMLAAFPEVLPGTGDAVSLDARVLGFTLLISAGTALIFGLLPARQASQSDPAEAMKHGARAGAGGGTARSVLVVAQVALAVLLVIGAGLMIRSFAALRRAEPGIDRQGVLTMEMSLRGTRFQGTAAVARLVDEGVRRLRTLPGVTSAASSWTLPVELAFGSSVFIEGRPLPGNSPVHGPAMMRPVSSDFFAVFRVPLLRGRFFSDSDKASVAVISEAMAKKYWPGGDPVGQRITLDKYLGPDFDAPPREIIGVAGNVRDVALDQAPEPMVYLLQSQMPDGMTKIDTRVLPITWAVRTAGPPHTLRPAIERELRTASGGLPVGRVRSMEEVIRRSTARRDLNTLLLTIFAALALLLAAVGIYGVIAYSVEQRTRELGIRMALGAEPGGVRNMVVGQGVRLALIGVALGAFASLGLARYLAAMLYGVDPTDPAIIGAACLILALVALLASAVPAIRAARLSPVESLRLE